MDEISKFMQELSSKSTMARTIACNMLVRIGKPAVPALIETLNNGNAGLKWYAASALGEIGDVSAIPALMDRCNLEPTAARALGKIAEKNPGDEEILKAVPALIEMLKNNKLTPWWAGWALGKIAENNQGNPELLKATPVLIEKLRADDFDVRKEAVEALGAIGDVSAVPALIEALESENGEVRLKATQALGKFIDNSSVEQLDKIKTQIIEAVEHADRYAPVYREMKRAAAPLIGAIYNRRNTLLPVEVNIDSNIVLKRPKPPKGSRGMYRAFAMVN